TTTCSLLIPYPSLSLSLSDPSSTLFPYTTLFRSHLFHARSASVAFVKLTIQMRRAPVLTRAEYTVPSGCGSNPDPQPGFNSGPRSEEHTSELQSHLNLVCRLLLEKKKYKIIYICN